MGFMFENLLIMDFLGLMNDLVNDYGLSMIKANYLDLTKL
jgi:hypothetical protein